IERRAVAEADGLRRIVALILPALERSDQLIEECFAALADIANGGQHWRGSPQATIGQPFPIVFDLLEPRFSLFAGFSTQRALPAAPHARLRIIIGRHHVRVPKSLLFAVLGKLRATLGKPPKQYIRPAERRLATFLGWCLAEEEQLGRIDRRL